jgi:hypothetical protein
MPTLLVLGPDRLKQQPLLTCFDCFLMVFPAQQQDCAAPSVLQIIPGKALLDCLPFGCMLCTILQGALGGIVYLELPEVGSEVSEGKALAFSNL